MQDKQLDFIADWGKNEVPEWTVRVTQIRDSVNRGLSMWLVETESRNYLFGSALQAAKFAQQAIEINGAYGTIVHTTCGGVKA
jgi:hypothetical protein